MAVLTAKEKYERRVLPAPDGRIPYGITDPVEGQIRVFRHPPLPVDVPDIPNAQSRSDWFHSFERQVTKELSGIHPTHIGDLFHFLTGEPCPYVNAIITGLSRRLLHYCVYPGFADLVINCEIPVDIDGNLLVHGEDGELLFRGKNGLLRVFGKVNSRLDLRRNPDIHNLLTADVGLDDHDVFSVYEGLRFIEGTCYLSMYSRAERNIKPLTPDRFDRMANGRTYNGVWGVWEQRDRLFWEDLRNKNLDWDYPVTRDPLHEWLNVFETVTDRDTFFHTFCTDDQPSYVAKGMAGYRFEPADGVLPCGEKMQGYHIRDTDGFQMASPDTQNRLTHFYLRILRRYFLMDGDGRSTLTTDLILRIRRQACVPDPATLAHRIREEVVNELPYDWSYRLDYVFFSLLYPALRNVLLTNPAEVLNGFRSVIDITDVDSQLDRLEAISYLAQRVHRSMSEPQVITPSPPGRRVRSAGAFREPIRAPLLVPNRDGFVLRKGGIDQGHVRSIMAEYYKRFRLILEHLERINEENRRRGRVDGCGSTAPFEFVFIENDFNRAVQLNPIVEVCGDLSFRGVRFRSYRGDPGAYPSLTSIAEGIRDAQNLVAFRMTGVTLVEGRLSVVISQFPLCQTLETLEFTGQVLNLVEWGQLCESVRGCHNFERDSVRPEHPSW